MADVSLPSPEVAPSPRDQWASVARRVHAGHGARRAAAGPRRRTRSSSGSASTFLSDGKFLTPRNLWFLTVQTASIAIMATGMVLVIVSRNIDLSVGSMLGFIA